MGSTEFYMGSTGLRPVLSKIFDTAATLGLILKPWVAIVSSKAATKLYRTL